MPETELLPPPAAAADRPAAGSPGPLPSSAPARRRRPWGRIAGAGLLLAALYLALRLTVLAPQPVAVTVTTVARGEVESTVTNSRAGTVAARHRAKLSPEVGGRVVELPFAKGARVAAGDVVLRLDDSLQRAHAEVAVREQVAVAAQAQAACIAVEQARRELQRNRDLLTQGIVSADLIDRLESNVGAQSAACEAGRRSAESATAAVALARAELARTVLRAPFPALVAELSTHLGEYVSPSPPAVPIPPVIDLLDPASLYVTAPMDEVDAARLRQGLPVRVAVDTYPGRALPGKVVRVAPYVLDVEQQNRTVEIEVELDDQALASSLLPGTSADVEVILEVRQAALRIPTQALLEEHKVLVLAGGRLAEREVEIGLRNWDFTEIRGGLGEGDQVVLSLDRDGVEAGALAVADPVTKAPAAASR